MTIRWKDKPSNYDAHLVTQIWFNATGTQLHYTQAHDGHVFTVKSKDVARIINDDRAFEPQG